MTAKPKFKVGDVVFTRWFVPGHPDGLSTDTRAIVIERSNNRYRVEREDHGNQSWWVDGDGLLLAERVKR